MPEDLFQISFLAALQGLTEFLPISSSGHLILPAALLGWDDQGLVFDVSVHVGSLGAVVLYFRAQLLELFRGWCLHVTRRVKSDQATLAWLIVLATIPAGLAGLFLNSFIEQNARNILLIASTSLFFAVLLQLADSRGLKSGDLSTLTWRKALLVGVAQMLALLPGTSRSGVTMTAGLFINLSRQAAARFSFLLSIPIIAASGLLKTVEFYSLSAPGSAWITLIYGALLSGIVSYFCIHYFLRLIERIGFLPFVVYRILLGVVLLVIYFAG